MKTPLFWKVIVISLAAAGAAWSDQETENAKTRLTLDLLDGSRIIGTPDINIVPVQTSYAKMDVPLKEILSLKMGDDQETASIALRNGDKLTGFLNIGPINLETIFGKVVIGVEHVRELRVVLSGELTLPASLRKGLVLYYSFDRPGSGGAVIDKSGKGNHGKVKGAKWAAAGNYGSYVLSENTDEITSSDLHLPTGDAARTVSFWFALNANTSASAGSFVSWGTGQHNQSSTIGFDRRVDRHGVSFGQYGAVDVSSKKITKPDEWHHAVFVYTGSGNMRFYVDGADHGLQADEIQSPINTVLSGQVRLGASDLKCQLGEVMIYDRALSEQEVDQIFNLQKKSFMP